MPVLSPDVPVDLSPANEATEAAAGAGIGSSSERWYVVTIGRDVGIFSNWYVVEA